MSEREPRPERLIALFVTVLWAAVVFAVDGVLAVLLDRDPIESDVGPYYAILAFALAGLVLWVLLSGTSTSRRPAWGAVGAVALVYLVFLVAALPWGLTLVAEQGLSPFVIAAALLAGAAVVATWAGIRALRRRDTRG
jgi:drug/metabolite transporter (DMT)-like permease